MSTPAYDEQDLLDRSPSLARFQRKRLAPSRWRDLVRAAGSARPPQEPQPWDCCGSSCKPCVRELYKEERRVWDEVHPDGISDAEEDDDKDRDSGPTAADKAVSKASPSDSHKAEQAEKVVQAKGLSTTRSNDTPAIDIVIEALVLKDGRDAAVPQKVSVAS